MTWLEYDSLDLGKKIKYRLDIDAAGFEGRAGMPWLIMAANPHLSINDLLEVMEAHGYGRTRSWIARRRLMFSDVRKPGGVREEARARRIMDAHPRVSARELARILGLHAVRIGCSKTGCVSFSVCSCPI